MRRLTTIAFLLLVVLALTAAGCGGDDEASTATPTEEWADDFCGAVTTWTDDLQQIGDSISDSSSSVDALREAGQQASDATDAFVQEVRGLGAPETESGDQIESSLDTLGDTLETEQNDISTAVEGIENLSDLPAAVTTIGTSLTAMGTALQTALTAIEDEDVGGELESAFDDSDACAEISQSGSN